MTAVWVETSPTNMMSKTIYLFLIIICLLEATHNRLYDVTISQFNRGHLTSRRIWTKYTEPGRSHFSTGDVLRVYYWTFIIISPNFFRLVTPNNCVYAAYAVHNVYNLYNDLLYILFYMTTRFVIPELDVVTCYYCCNVVLVFWMYFITSTFLSHFSSIPSHITLIIIYPSKNNSHQSKGLSAVLKSGSQLWHCVWCLSINR
jgi:hypothetical protein